MHHVRPAFSHRPRGSTAIFPLLKTFGGWRIERRPPGFEFAPGLVGKISTYALVPPVGAPRLYAFMYSFLVAGEAQEVELATAALGLIEDQIQAGIADSAPERTFEYIDGGWWEVASPRWWVGVAPTPRVGEHPAPQG